MGKWLGVGVTAMAAVLLSSGLAAQPAASERGQLPSPELQSLIDSNAYADALPLAKAEMQACEAALTADAALGRTHCFLVRQETLHLALFQEDNAFAIAEAERLLTDSQSGDSILHLEARLTAINILSLAYSRVGDFEKALTYLQMDLAVSKEVFGENSREVAVSLLNIGVMYDHRLRQHETGLAYYQQGEAVLRAGGHERTEDMATALGHQGRAYDNLGLPYQSGVYYRRAIALVESLPAEEQSRLPVIRQNYAAVLNQTGHWQEAQAQLRLAMVELERMYGHDSGRLSAARQSLAVSLYMQGRYSDAAVMLDALWAQSLEQEDTRNLAFISLWQARLAVARGAYDTAERWLDDNAAQVARLPADFPVMRAQAGMERAEIAYLRRDYPGMRRHVEALAAMPEASLGASDLIAIRQWQGEYALLTGDTAAALTHVRDARARAGKVMPADAPLLTVLDGKIAYILSLQDPHSGEAMRMMNDAAARAVQSGYHGPAALARSQGPVSGFRDMFLDQLDMIRRAGGDVAAAMVPAHGLLNSGAAGAGQRLQRLREADTPALAALVRDRDVVREKLRWIDRKIGAGQGAEALALAEEERRLTAQIAELDPQFDARIVDAPVDLATIQARLGDGEVMLLMLEDARRGVHMLAVGKDTAQWHFIDDPHLQKLRPLLATLNASYGATTGVVRGQAGVKGTRPDDGRFAEAQAHVSDMLLGPVAQSLHTARHVHSISTGAIGTIPLASLPFDAAYVADIAPVSRYTSLTAFAAAQPKGAAKVPPPSTMRVLAIAPDYAEVAGYADLPFAREQMAFLEQLGFADLTQLTGAQANERTVKQASALAKADLILFASHSVYVEGQGPAFLLQKGEGEDGTLTADEIALLSTNADLVILSACTTAAAGPDEADALSGMARGFLLSGSRGIVISHWPVEDKAAAELGSAMLGHMAANPGATPAEALRHAALALRAQGGRFAHPRYWAAFSLVEE